MIEEKIDRLKYGQFDIIECDGRKIEIEQNQLLFDNLKTYTNYINNTFRIPDFSIIDKNIINKISIYNDNSITIDGKIDEKQAIELFSEIAFNFIYSNNDILKIFKESFRNDIIEVFNKYKVKWMNIGKTFMFVGNEYRIVHENKKRINVTPLDEKIDLPDINTIFKIDSNSLKVVYTHKTKRLISLEEIK